MQKTLFSIAILLLALTGCSSTTTLTPVQVSALEESKLSIGAVTQADNAVKAPNPTTEPGYNSAVPAGTGGGLIPALIGAAIDSSIKADQRKNFDEKYSEYFEAVDKNTPEDLSNALNDKLADAVTSNEFFAPLIVEESRIKLNTTITAYGLNRTNKINDEVFLTFGVSALVEMASAGEKPIIKKIFSAQAGKEYTMKDYAEQEQLITEMSLKAVENLSKQIKEHLELLTAFDKK